MDEAITRCLDKQMGNPGMMSLTNLPSQTTLLLPAAPEFPCMRDLENSLGVGANGGACAGNNTATSSSDSVSSLPPNVAADPSNSFKQTSTNDDDGEPSTIIESVS